jgi:hypothetical protein
VSTTIRTDDPSELDAVRRVVRDERMPYPCYLDRGSQWARTADLHARPAFLLIGRDGRVAYYHRGPLTADTPAHVRFVAAVERALATPP